MRGLLDVLFRLSPIVALELALDRLVRFLAVAVVRFVVQDEDPFQAHQLGHHALQDLSVRLAGAERLQQRRARPRTA